jgi:hypothetical protein
MTLKSKDTRKDCMTKYGKDFKENIKELRDRVLKGDTKLENQLRGILGKPKPKEELFREYPILEEYYNSIGNNPIDEPELDFEVEEMEKSYFIDFYVQRLKDVKGFKFDKIDFEDIRLFASKVAIKIKSFTDEDGILKKIDKFNNIDFSEIQKKTIVIAKIVKQYDNKVKPIKKEAEKKIELMLEGYDPDFDDAQEFENERLKLVRQTNKEIAKIGEEKDDKIDKAICKILSIKREDWSDWEFDLLKRNALAMINYNGHTPFTKGEL